MSPSGERFGQPGTRTRGRLIFPSTGPMLAAMTGSPVPSYEHEDSPEVAALRKRIRGEPLSAAEDALLASATRKPSGPGVLHAEVMAELAERERRGE